MVSCGCVGSHRLRRSPRLESDRCVCGEDSHRQAESWVVIAHNMPPSQNRLWPSEVGYQHEADLLWCLRMFCEKNRNRKYVRSIGELSGEQE